MKSSRVGSGSSRPAVGKLGEKKNMKKEKKNIKSDECDFLLPSRW